MSESLPIILRHSKSTAVEGRDYLIGVLGFVALCGVLQYFTFPLVKPTIDFLVVFFTIEALVCLGFFVPAVLSIWARREFVCELDAREIRCVGAVWGWGKNFRLPLDEITRIENGDKSDFEFWKLIDRAGRSYWLTTNYENPARYFVAEIMSLRPEIVETAK